MPGGGDFYDDLHNEILSLAAENFFSSRKRLEERRERFAGLAETVRAAGVRALGCWRTLLLLLADGGEALHVLGQAGMDAALLAEEAGRQAPARMEFPFALTGAGRYRKGVRQAYLAARQATLEYLEGTYVSDPRNPARRMVTPNYRGLRDLAEKINKEATMLNSGGMSPSNMLAYVKSLDPAAVDRESHAGGFTGEDMGKIDRDMAVKPVDFEALGLPVLAEPAPLEAMESTLRAAGKLVFRERRAEALAVMARCEKRGGA